MDTKEDIHYAPEATQSGVYLPPSPGLRLFLPLIPLMPLSFCILFPTIFFLSISLSFLYRSSFISLLLPFLSPSLCFHHQSAESPKEEQLYSIHLNLILFHFLLDFSAIQVRIKMEVRIRIPVRHKVTRTGGTVHYTVSMQVAKMMNSEAQERDF